MGWLPPEAFGAGCPHCVVPGATPLPSWSPDPMQDPRKSQPGAEKGEQPSEHTKHSLSQFINWITCRVTVDEPPDSGRGNHEH